MACMIKQMKQMNVTHRKLDLQHVAPVLTQNVNDFILVVLQYMILLMLIAMDLLLIEFAYREAGIMMIAMVLYFGMEMVRLHARRYVLKKYFTYNRFMFGPIKFFPKI